MFFLSFPLSTFPIYVFFLLWFFSPSFRSLLTRPGPPWPHAYQTLIRPSKAHIITPDRISGINRNLHTALKGKPVLLPKMFVWFIVRCCEMAEAAKATEEPTVEGKSIDVDCMWESIIRTAYRR